MYLGIDPGKDSFICSINDDLVGFNRIPMKDDMIDLWGLYDVLSGYSNYECIAVLEDVHSVFGSSAKANFEFGRVNGILEAMLVSCGIRYHKVQPKKWQSDIWPCVDKQKKKDSNKTDTKLTSLLAAQKLFPFVDLRKSERSRIADHNKVDALLIAEHCRRNY